LDRIVPRGLSARNIWGRIGRIAVYIGLALLTLPAAGLLAGAIVGADPIGLALSGLILARWSIVRWAGRFERPSDLLARPAAFATAYAVLLVPTAAGLAMTLQAAGRILGNG
jgi:hypothetical protein